MAFPKVFHRRTNHSKPRFQLYVPGFNQHNSCWIDGSWITLPKDEWEARKDEHERLFANVRAEAAKQSHRADPTPPDKMSPAQRMAYEHYSGMLLLHAREGGRTISFWLRTAGNRPVPGEVEGLRDRKAKIIRYEKNGYTGKVTDMLEGLDVPADVVLDEGPIDPWVDVIKQNRQNHQALFKGAMDMSSPEGAADGLTGSLGGFASAMAVQFLIEKEQEIIRDAWNRQRGKHDPYAEHPDEARRQYVAMRASLAKSLGDQFEPSYEKARATHNQCARHNLGETGVLFCFVLPAFHEDGSHEPWGERDVPWGVGDD